MNQFLCTATVLWIYLLSVNSSFYILSNDANIRIISALSNCTEGRIEFFNGTRWGTLSDCTHSFHVKHSRSICQTLGFDTDTEYWIGTTHYDPAHIIHNPAIAYTNVNNCSFATQNSLCHQCLFTKNINSCNNTLDYNDIHRKYDIFVSCKNWGLDTKNSKYECLFNDYTLQNTEYSSQSCANMYSITNERESNKTLLITVIGIAIFASILGVIIFALYSKWQDTKRLAKSTSVSRLSSESDGFATVPQDAASMMQLAPIKVKKKGGKTSEDIYVPPPQPMFIYQTRNAKKRSTDMDVEEESVENGGYNMEEIIPTVIYNTKSHSESYGLIKNHDYDEDEIEVNDQSELIEESK